MHELSSLYYDLSGVLEDYKYGQEIDKVSLNTLHRVHNALGRISKIIDRGGRALSYEVKKIQEEGDEVGYYAIDEMFKDRFNQTVETTVDKSLALEVCGVLNHMASAVNVLGYTKKAGVKPCKCRFDDETDEPVHVCEYHTHFEKSIRKKVLKDFMDGIRYLEDKE